MQKKATGHSQMVRTFLQPWSGDNELKKNHKPAPLATNSTVADLECVKGVVDGCILKTDGLNLFGLFGEDRSIYILKILIFYLCNEFRKCGQFKTLLK